MRTKQEEADRSSIFLIGALGVAAITLLCPPEFGVLIVLVNLSMLLTLALHRRTLAYQSWYESLPFATVCGVIVSAAGTGLPGVLPHASVGGVPPLAIVWVIAALIVFIIDRLGQSEGSSAAPISIGTPSREFVAAAPPPPMPSPVVMPQTIVAPSPARPPATPPQPLPAPPPPQPPPPPPAIVPPPPVVAPAPLAPQQPAALREPYEPPIAPAPEQSFPPLSARSQPHLVRNDVRNESSASSPELTTARAAQAAPAPLRGGKPVDIFVNLMGEGMAMLRSVKAEHVGRDFYHIIDVMPDTERWEFRPGQVVRCQKRNLSSGKALVAIEEAPRAN